MLVESKNVEQHIAASIASGASGSTKANVLLKSYKNLLQKYQCLAVDYYKKDTESKNTINQLLKHVDHLNQENQRLMVENRLLNENNLEAMVKLQKSGVFDVELVQELFKAMTETKIPVTIVTGFLGTGKTTFIKRLCGISPKKIGVIQNEFSSEMGIERPALLQSGAELYELPNGCICCSTKDGLVTAVESVLQYGIEWIVIEAAGTADPVVLAGNFWLDYALESPLVLDGVICITDATVLKTLASPSSGEIHELLIKQLSVADLIIVNKTDIHPLEAKLEENLQILNECKIISAVNGVVDLDSVSNLNMFDLSKLLRATPTTHEHGHSQKSALESVLVKSKQIHSLTHINDAISSLLWDQDNIYRCKGIFSAKRDCEMIDAKDGTNGTFELQGVGKVFEITPIHADVQENKFLFIGHNINKDHIHNLLTSYSYTSTKT
ncbi:CobW/P47K family member protein [Theileria equi strain WA]|uniref:CobW/P47K family member protein n=1 Tax=Theileria equi strain WA TaxID=1537102 RepID=L1LDV1_THEEQ|nr:CobW/P47K family member protein [Theileria equi strain WA]EKX73425.1 CobW/P47K family member protein [Theileria equi strain WA]|eukprot:XP_004832877.1 CobW/P47K family member protein [Theileria equi strain WA]